jgi:hypothetical protein
LRWLQDVAGSGRYSKIRPATANQNRAIHALANRQNLDLVEQLRGRFGIERLEELTLDQASRLIDAIKPSSMGLPASDESLRGFNAEVGDRALTVFRATAVAIQ